MEELEKMVLVALFCGLVYEVEVRKVRLKVKVSIRSTVWARKPQLLHEVTIPSFFLRRRIVEQKPEQVAVRSYQIKVVFAELNLVRARSCFFQLLTYSTGAFRILVCQQQYGWFQPSVANIIYQCKVVVLDHPVHCGCIWDLLFYAKCLLLE